MATGERVLVVSRGEAALAVLKDQLPKEVQPLAIAVISNERQGLRQLERAIREIEAVVEGTSPEKGAVLSAAWRRRLMGCATYCSDRPRARRYCGTPPVEDRAARRNSRRACPPLSWLTGMLSLGSLIAQELRR